MLNLTTVAALAIAAGAAFWAGDASADYHRNRAAVSDSSAPLAFDIFCLQNPAQCRASGKSSVAPTGDLMHLISQVNNSVNHSIRPRADTGGDSWNIVANGGYGDCEDYALTKRSRLISLGVSPSALRLAYVKTAWGEGHAVLVVRTSGQELVLDNLTSAILPLHSTSLHVISVSGANPMQWSNG